jgi:isoprenylcysteine carboxyl methyltransferase (ICMT) family protein YpbQ
MTSLNSKHIVHYLVLLGLMAIAFSTLVLVSLTRTQQLVVIILTAVMYVAYGIFHHKLHHDLTIKIVVEYALVALLVVALFLFVRGGM